MREKDGPALAGATVAVELSTLRGWHEHTAATDETGRYEIPNLTAARYIVTRVTPPPGAPPVQSSWSAATCPSCSACATVWR